MNSVVKDFPTNKLNNPLTISTITNKDIIQYEAITIAPKEFNLPEKARVRWKIAKFDGRNYDFIIGTDILTYLNAFINMEEKTLTLNKENRNTINPYNINEICTLETTGDGIEGIKLDHLNLEEHKEVMKILKRFKTLFFKEGDRLTSITTVQHEIRTTTNEQINSKLYRYPPQHEEEVRRQIREMEAQGIIRKSQSRYSSPLIVVPKKRDNSGKQKYRIVIDYRKLNEKTIDDKYPLPNINSILDKLGKAQYFTTIDLAKGYHQIMVREQDKEKTAFVTPNGLYEFIRMPFGLKNAPPTFQKIMNETLRDFINKTCVVYLDDILIFSTSLQEHVKSIRDI